PRPLPVEIELPSGSGWGASEAQTGSVRGAGIEVRGLREYTTGDCFRYVDWRSSARTGRLQVKEFEAGTHGRLAIVIQQNPGLDPPGVALTAFDAMCGHALGVASRLMRQGVSVTFPDFETIDRPTRAESEREEELALMLGAASAASGTTLADSVRAAAANAPAGAGIVLLVGIDDGTVEEAVAAISDRGEPTLLLYDPRDYDGTFTGTPITASGVLDTIRRSGAMLVTMPRVEGEGL
ncbi:DUF58 domain-containing protein, partial [bacterium]